MATVYPEEVAGKADFSLFLKECKGYAQRGYGIVAGHKKVLSRTLTPELKAQMEHYHKTHAPKVINKNMALDYTVNDDCIHCGTCARVCPANNVTVTEDKVIFGDRCEVCYACLHNCPKKAIHLPVEKANARFRNEHVSLNDIIRANE